MGKLIKGCTFSQNFNKMRHQKFVLAITLNDRSVYGTGRQKSRISFNDGLPAFSVVNNLKSANRRRQKSANKYN